MLKNNSEEEMNKGKTYSLINVGVFFWFFTLSVLYILARAELIATSHVHIWETIKNHVVAYMLFSLLVIHIPIKR